MRVRGSCLCGAIVYTVADPMDNMSHCHCAICRKTHGALFGTYLYVDQRGFSWEQGEDHVRVYESSPGFKRAFCPTCGSVVPSDNMKERYAVPAGALEDDCGVRPKSNIFAKAKAPWYDITDGLPQFSGYFPGIDRPTIAVESRSAGRENVVGGSCQCAAVAFEYDGPAKFMWNCHCRRCRKAKGAAHATNAFVEEDDFRWVKGADDIVAYRLPKSKRFGQAFCRHCGSLVARALSKSTLMNIPVGALDDHPGCAVKGHVYVSSKAPWFELTDALPCYAEMPSVS